MRVYFNVEHIHIGEAFEEHAFAFHHRLGSQRAPVAETEDGCAIGDDRDEVGLGGVFIGGFRAALDFEDDLGDAGRVGQRQVTLGDHGFGRDDFNLARTALLMVFKSFLSGDGHNIRPF